MGVNEDFEHVPSPAWLGKEAVTDRLAAQRPPLLQESAALLQPANRTAALATT